MQHKRGNSRVKLLLVLAIIAVGATITLLSSANPLPPTHTIEKQLDAKAFLEQKQ